MLYAATWQSIRDISLPRPYHLLDPRGYTVEDARNMIVAGALTLDPHVTHLLWIDDDMVFERDAAERLLDRDLPIVGGLCHNRRHPYMPILMRKWPPGVPARGYGYVYDWESEVEAGGSPIMEVDATGAAFLLVKREVFEKLGPNPFRNTGGGEDVSFCERARAAGYSIKVDTSLDIGHIGEVIVNKAFAKTRTFAFNPWTPTAAVTKAGLRILGDEDTPDGHMHRARYRWASDVLAAAQREAGGKQIDRADFRVLDYGCGTGHGTDLLRTTGFDACGCDPDLEAIAYGREHSNLRGRLTTFDLSQPPKTPTDAPFEVIDFAVADVINAIVAFEVIEHLDAPPAETLARLLKRAPIVIGSVPYLEPAGFNPHHKHSMLDSLSLGIASDVTVFGQKWGGEIGPLVDRATTPIMLFIARRK
jgi:SAM-dependent methyltransferase